jgi:quercetin dioxygenase-like cupin family protein
MNLKNLHTENKPVQTKLLFEPKESKVISMQIGSGELLKEHVSKTPALLVCVSGNAVFTNEKDQIINLSSGNYVMIDVNVKHEVKAIEESNFLLIK